jgi:Protein of unknown function, DUF547
MNPSLRYLLALFLVGVVAHTALGAPDNWTESYDRLLKKYVTPGGVKYAAWKGNASDLQELKSVVDAIGTANVGSMSKNDQLAFYINAYNAWILNEALGKYPTKSVKDTFFTFFTGKRIKVAGQQTSFNALEKETIRSKFGDPRIHFALNCASKSCPPLLAGAFRGGNLESQMDTLARNFINSPKGVNYQEAAKAAELSKIFDWYKDDFKDGGPIAFINKRRSKPLPNDVKISYQEYDWSLNEAR